MHSLQNKSRPVSSCEAPIKNRNIGYGNQTYNKVVVKQANSADIKEVFKKYGVNLDKYTKKCRCPFPFHKKDNSPSFTLYDDTNSFSCFGCNSGGGPTNFVSLMENISIMEAAEKIISGSEVNLDVDIDVSDDSEERRAIYLEFSEIIRSFIFNNLDDKIALDYCEKITYAFDKIIIKNNKINNVGLRTVVYKLKIKLEQYKCQ